MKESGGDTVLGSNTAVPPVQGVQFLARVDATVEVHDLLPTAIEASGQVPPGRRTGAETDAAPESKRLVEVRCPRRDDGEGNAAIRGPAAAFCVKLQGHLMGVPICRLISPDLPSPTCRKPEAVLLRLIRSGSECGTSVFCLTQSLS